MAVGLRDRVQTILRQPGKTEDDRVHEAIETVAGDVEEISRRLAVIDPEWELLARQELDIDAVLEKAS